MMTDPRPGPDTPCGHQFSGMVNVVEGRAEEFGVDRHRGSGTDQDDGQNLLGVAGRRLDGHERAHRVAHDVGRRDTERAGGFHHPIGHLHDRGQRWAICAAMAGQVERGHAKTVVGQPAGLELPGGAIHAGAVYQHHPGIITDMGPPAV